MDFKELDSKLDKKLSKYGRCYHPANGAVCIIDGCFKSDDVIKSVRVFSQSEYGGSYGVCYGYTNDLPMKEMNYIQRQHFDDPSDAYKFVIARAKKINKFFNT